MENPQSSPYLGNPSDGLYRNAFIVLAVGTLIAGIIKYVRFRQEFLTMNKNLVKPPFTILGGTIPLMIKLFQNAPLDLHPIVPLTMADRKLGLGPFYLLDSWPLAPRMMIIRDPEIASQVITHHSKHPTVTKFVGHICGPRSMLYAEPSKWKKSRALFNPGFSVGHLMTLVGSIVDNTLIFKQVLSEKADQNELFGLEPLAAKLAIDVMGTIVLDHKLHALTTTNPLVEAFQLAAYYSPPTSPFNPFAEYNPYSAYMRWKTERIMDRYLDKVLEDRFKSGATSKSTGRGKPIIDLALTEYYKQLGPDADTSVLEDEFKKDAIDQMKTFLFAGHDTTSSTLCFVYYLLAQHPEAAAKVRAELDEVLGPDRTAAPEIIRQDPHILNKLIYTQAVIKETLRLFPPASSVRIGNPDMNLVYDGETYKTGNWVVWISSHSIHRRPDLWPEPDSFIPERFLPAPHNYQEIAKDAWRPFEKGMRNCIGQELAMLELRVFVALTVRDIDIIPDYAGWDEKMGREKPGDTLDGRRGAFGYRAYQVLHATAKPADDMPVRIRRR